MAGGNDVLLTILYVYNRGGGDAPLSSAMEVGRDQDWRHKGLSRKVG